MVPIDGLIDDRSSDIAIIGYDGRFPGARSPRELWRNLCDGTSGIRQFTEAELEAHGVPAADLRDPRYVRAAAVLDDVEAFDAAFFGISPREAELMDPQGRLFLEVCWSALEQAGYDPSGFTDRVGVFAGARTNTYLLHLLRHEDLAGTVGAFHLGLVNDLGFLTTRLSHCLNLTGPSCAIQSACSTSLVAVHMAVRSLRAGECRVAIAGGAVVNVPHVAGYIAEDGGVASPAGTCRVFDASARGTVFGSGVAVVVLKRLAHALRDGDYVHAVIKGSAINNDGSAKASFTAPAVRGQVAVIEEALADAGIGADTIGYVEAHGTGTLLGDAIEVRALTKAYRKSTRGERFCALSSVKTNVGHLDAAAGVTGLITVIESLKHGQLAPMLHYRQPNPQIELDGSPFYVNTELRPWTPERGGVRRAAVSAFGVGGTNAHVIVEEAPPREKPDAGRAWQVLVWSARTAEALPELERNLADALRDDPGVSIADAAWTLQAGRQRMAWRRAALCRDAAEAIAALDEGGEARHDGEVGEDTEIVFLFPGQGAQYAGMARDLYEQEPVFGEAIDRCAALLTGHLGRDIRPAMFADCTGDLSLHETWLAQPSVFATEYALVKLWESWGVRPAAMLGHSLGEYVAACVAGVLTLEDALRLVALRGRLMQEMPRGAMLAVELGEQEIGAWLNGGVWLSAVNGAHVCTVGGREPEIAALEQGLRAAGHGAQRLRTSHAYHTPLMEGMLDRYVDAIANTPRGPASVPYISNVTGTWIREDEIADPAYWGRQVRAPVRFARGVDTLLADGPRLMLEVGPGQGLSRLVRRRGDAEAYASLGRGAQSDTEAMLTALAHAWAAGAEVDWRAFHGSARRQRVPLPAYPFQRTRYWIDAPAPHASAAKPRASSATGGAAALRVPKIDDARRWFWAPTWTLTPDTAPPPSRDRAGEHWLMFADHHGLAARLTQDLRAAGADVVIVSHERGAAPAPAMLTRTGPDAFILDSANAEHYRQLADTLRQEHRPIAHVCHLWGVSRRHELPDDAEGFERVQPAAFHSLLHIARELTGAATGTLRSCWVISSDTQAVESLDRPHPAKVSSVALCKVLSQEANVRPRFIDLAYRDIAADMEAVRQRLAAELDHDMRDIVIALREARRWSSGYVPIAMDDGGAAPFPLREGGVYVITGGLGAVGTLIAAQLAEECRARLVLTTREAAPPREDWPENDTAIDLLAPDIARKIRAVRAIEAAGGAVRVMAADVANPDDLRRVVDTCVREMGGVDGIIHAAGVTSGPSLFRTIQEATPEHCREQARPKVHGLFAIEQAIRDVPVGFVLAMSSNAAVLGGLGFLSYAAANAEMDAFVASRAAHGGSTRWLSANWDHWPEETRKYHDVTTSMDEYAMTRDQARDATRIVLTRCRRGQVVVATGDLQARLGLWLHRDHAAAAPRETAVSASRGGGTLAPRPKLRTAYVEPANELERTMAEIWAAYLGISPVGTQDDFFELGGHSLLAIQMVAEMSRALDRDVALRALFEGPTVAQLARACATDAPPADAQPAAAPAAAAVE